MQMVSLCFACLTFAVTSFARRWKLPSSRHKENDHPSDLADNLSPALRSTKVESNSMKALAPLLIHYGSRNLDFGIDFDLVGDQMRRGVDQTVEMVKQRPGPALGILALLRASWVHLNIKARKRSSLLSLREQVANGKPLHITIVTTAALPWKTGTAVNALLRAAYCADAGHQVTFVVPWIHPEEQAQVFPGGDTFATPAEQEAHMREWLLDRDGEHSEFEIRFYPARYDLIRGSILPLGDTTRWIGDGPHDLCVLEEPEHLNWYHGGRNWRKHFKLVIGIVHTNYMSYAEMYQPENAFACKIVNNLVCRSYCDRVVKLSDCLQDLPRSSVCNVHGVRAEFIAEGRRVADLGPAKCFSKGAYFIGKTLWAKGFRLMIDYLSNESSRENKRIDVYGEGDDTEEIDAAAKASGLQFSFFGPRDHADESLQAYKVFVNPSQTEVLSTTTAEALAMGKFVVIEKHPSNVFFYRFSNTLTYETPEEFRAALNKALSSVPAPLTEAESRALSWPGATERFLDLVNLLSQLATSPCLRDSYAHFTHLTIVSGWKGYFGDMLKKYVYQSGPVSRQRWLHSERRYRESTSVEEVVNKSIAVSPPQSSQDWAERYGENEQLIGAREG